MKIFNNAYLHLKNACRKQNLGEEKYQEYRKNLKEYVDVLVWSDKNDLENEDIENGLTILAKKRINIESKIIEITDQKTLNEIRVQFESLKVKYCLDEISIQKIEREEHYDPLNSIGVIIHNKSIACSGIPNEIF